VGNEQAVEAQLLPSGQRNSSLVDLSRPHTQPLVQADHVHPESATLVLDASSDS
jgi:hypothetical protein